MVSQSREFSIILLLNSCQTQILSQFAQDFFFILANVSVTAAGICAAPTRSYNLKIDLLLQPWLNKFDKNFSVPFVVKYLYIYIVYRIARKPIAAYTRIDISKKNEKNVSITIIIMLLGSRHEKVIIGDKAYIEIPFLIFYFLFTVL